MFKHLWKVALAASLLMFAHSFYFWGGIGLTPNVGDRVLMQSAKQFDLLGIGFYTHTGKAMMGILAPDAAQTYAANQVGQVYPSLDGDKYTAAQKIRAAMSSMQSFSHVGAPIALIAFIALYWLRPKPVRSLGR
jgi:hypothetical protein